ncbi:NAD-dependent epimerase/dehydratase family protein [Streptomyces sp. NPDC058701]|uniref:NAD-dependent epimerase/dehydratase family protein n=1 Tax=Streptomyces sp. NPDC058701 TaxID=3346608 RepID=UPI00365459CF
MKVLVTGSEGYIGTVLLPLFARAGHTVSGMDIGWFRDCLLGVAEEPVGPVLRVDVRDVIPRQLEGFDAVIHLAGISNDPLGDLNPRLTYDINSGGTVHLARMAKEAGVSRFVFSSSCSTYGAALDEELLDEWAPFRPVTCYGRSKVQAEEALLKLADSDFTPTFARNATAYGYSPRLRGDLAVNNLVGHAVTTSSVLLRSDGRAWRPLVHVMDIARAMLALTEAPRDLVHGRAYNVGSTEQNHRIEDVAATVARLVPGSIVRRAHGAVPDRRNYRVNCNRLRDELGFAPQWTLERGIEQLQTAYGDHHLTEQALSGPRFQRVRHIQDLLADGRLRDDLRPTVRRAAVGHV